MDDDHAVPVRSEALANYRTVVMACTICAPATTQDLVPEVVQVDAVLGLSMTPTAVGLVLVEGHEADGATMDRDAFAVHTSDRDNSVHTVQTGGGAVRRTQTLANACGRRLQSIGVTWTDEADTEASLLLESLTESGFDNVVPVRLPAATDALARGIADVIGYETTAVCAIEPETASSCWWSTRPRTRCRRPSTRRSTVTTA